MKLYMCGVLYFTQAPDEKSRHLLWSLCVHLVVLQPIGLQIAECRCDFSFWKNEIKQARSHYDEDE